MPDRDLVFGLRLRADGKGFVGDIRLARREVDRLSRSLGGSESAATRATRGQRMVREEVERAGKSFLEAATAGGSLLQLSQIFSAGRGVPPHTRG